MKTLIDISYHQDPSRINYDLLLSQVDGVIIRLGYGTGVEWKGWGNSPDPAFERNYAEVKARGKPVGCYHYMVEYQTVDAQLAIVKAALEGKEFELGFWPDVELEDGAPPLTRKTVVDYITKVDTYLPDGIEGIYTGAWAWNPIMGKDNPYSDKRLWVASYRSVPLLPYGWNKWWMQQYTASGRLDGYAGNLDMNTVSDENWAVWVDGKLPIPDKVLFRAKVLAKGLFVRSEPVYYSDNRNVVGDLSRGDVVDVYAVNEANGWYQIGVNRWCSGSEQFIEKIDDELPLTLEEKVEKLWAAHPELHG